MKDREQRFDFPMVSTIADGSLLFEGVVTNISKNGIKVVDIPAKFKLTSQEYRSVISAKGRNYRLAITPVWIDKKGLNLEVGFKIVAPTLDWNLLLRELDPPERDIWGYSD